MNIEYVKSGVVAVLTLVGLVKAIPFLFPVVAVAGTCVAFTAFANLNHEEYLEAQADKRQRKLSNKDAIDADEIIPPTRKRRASRNNETYDIPVNDYSMENERQVMRARMKEERLRRKLAETRSAIRSMEDPTR